MSEIRYITQPSIFEQLDRHRATVLLGERFGLTARERQAQDALTAFWIDPSEELRRAAVRALDRLPADRQLALRGRAW